METKILKVVFGGGTSTVTNKRTRTGVNIFDKDNVNVLNAYIANDKVTTNQNHCSVYIPCKPNTMYTVQKICVGSGDQDRFSIGYTVETSLNDAACYGIIHSTSASRVQEQMVSLSITTGQDAKFYGAYVDVTGGELVVDRAEIASYNGEVLPSTWISDRDVYASGTTPTSKMRVYVNNCEARSIHKLQESASFNVDNVELFKWCNTETSPVT